jgi:hypothetical protein
MVLSLSDVSRSPPSSSKSKEVMVVSKVADLPEGSRRKCFSLLATHPWRIEHHTLVGRYMDIISVRAAVACAATGFAPSPFRPIGESIAIGVEEMLGKGFLFVAKFSFNYIYI